MNLVEIPLTANNQSFSVTINDVDYQMSVIWRETLWSLDINDANADPVALALPLITGADLLAQYAYLNLGFSLIVLCDKVGQENPTQDDLGTYSHLYVFTE